MDDSRSQDALQPKYRRVVLKLSGEGFGHSGKSGISIDETLSVARQAQRVLQRGVQLAIVVGGGNILWRASTARRAFSPLSAWSTSPSRTSAGGPFGIWRKGALSSWRGARAI